MGNIECLPQCTPCTGETPNIPIVAATFEAVDNSYNRDNGKMADIMTAMNGNENWVRFRSGTSRGYTAKLALSTASNVSSVSLLVKMDPSGTAKGYSGIIISVSIDGGKSFRMVYNRAEMFGTYERNATYQKLARDFAFDKWVIHKLPYRVNNVTHIRLIFGAADQQHDNCVSFDGLRVEG